MTELHDAANRDAEKGKFTVRRLIRDRVGYVLGLAQLLSDTENLNYVSTEASNRGFIIEQHITTVLIDLMNFLIECSEKYDQE
jgi:hypothetical protein